MMRELHVVYPAVVAVVAGAALGAGWRLIRGLFAGTSMFRSTVGTVTGALRGAALVTVAIACIGGGLSAFGSTTGKWRAVPILSGSMEPGLDVGDIAVVQPKPLNEVAVGDVLVFNAPATHGVVREGEPVIHRVIEIVPHDGLVDTDKDAVYVRTKGDNNEDADPWIVEVDDTEVWAQTATIRDVGALFLLLARPSARFGLLAAAAAMLFATAIGTVITARREDAAEARAAEREVRRAALAETGSGDIWDASEAPDDPQVPAAEPAHAL